MTEKNASLRPLGGRSCSALHCPCGRARSRLPSRLRAPRGRAPCSLQVSAWARTPRSGCQALGEDAGEGDARVGALSSAGNSLRGHRCDFSDSGTGPAVAGHLLPGNRDVMPAAVRPWRPRCGPTVGSPGAGGMSWNRRRCASVAELCSALCKVPVRQAALRVARDPRTESYKPRSAAPPRCLST